MRLPTQDDFQPCIFRELIRMLGKSGLSAQPEASERLRAA